MAILKMNNNNNDFNFILPAKMSCADAKVLFYLLNQ